MASSQTIKVLKIQNIDKVIYQRTNWITRVDYEENDDDSINPDIPKLRPATTTQDKMNIRA